MTFNMIEKAGGVDAVGGIAVSLQTLCRHFTDPAGLIKENYQSMNFGLGKMILYLMSLYKSIFGKKYEKIQDVMHAKGMIVSGFIVMYRMEDSWPLSETGTRKRWPHWGSKRVAFGQLSFPYPFPYPIQ